MNAKNEFSVSANSFTQNFKHFKTVLLVIGLLSVTSCVSNYHFTPPTTESGKQCISKCDQQRKYCKTEISENDRKCKMSRQQSYEFCSFQSSSADRNTQCLQASLDKSCSVISYYSCMEDYNKCYQDCGGKAEKIK